MMVPPDTDSHWEMWLVFQIVAGVRNPWLLVVLFLLAVGYAVYKLIAITIARIVQIFKERAVTGQPHASILRWALGILIVFWILAILLLHYGAAGRMGSGPGLDVFACSTFVFIVLCVAIDWAEERRERAAQPVLPENLSIGDVMSWRSELEKAPTRTDEERR
jgi:hypothetical protein